MSRRRRAETRKVLPDPKFGDLVVTKFMNLAITMSPYLASGMISRFSAEWRRDMV